MIGVVYRKGPNWGFFLKNFYLYMPKYFKEVRAEMKHVTWPSRRLTIVYTLVVIAISLGTAVYLGLLDYIFEAVIKSII